MRRQPSLHTRAQRGAALLIFALILISTLLGTFLSRLNTATQTTQREQITTDTLMQAKEALIGFAASYRDTHPGEVFGYLPCPDTDNDGISDSCGATDVSLIGRLPWKTLGLPPLRDSTTECLWYAVSGNAKNSPKTAALNWDTPGQFIVQNTGGTTLAGAIAHEQPLALILAPHAPLGAQSRTPIGTPECGGSNTAADYFEGLGILGTATPPAANIISTIVLANADSVRAGTNNDRGLWITGKEVFDRIKKRTDFKLDIDAMLDDIATNYLNNIATASLPAAAGNKGIDTLITNYLAANPALSTQKNNVLGNWKNNLLYIKPGTATTVSGTAGCTAALFFGGERTAIQNRSTGANQLDATNYLEGSNASLFPASGSYTGTTHFDKTSTSADIIRCIKGAPTQISFATNFGSFIVTGVSVTRDTVSAPLVPTVSFDDSLTSSTGGCFWQPTIVPLAGKTLRAYYEFQFRSADTFALGSGSDNGNGFTFQMVRGDVGTPNLCGTENTMGALNGATTWGAYSFIIETDILRNSGSSSSGSGSDPAGNHTAIMTNGSLDHSSGGIPGVACNGTESGCRHTPANTFEESPAPLLHNQRLEIKTGCNSTCSSCIPASHLAPNNYAQITVWVDCTDCNDVAANLDRVIKIPTIQRCTILNPEMNSIYFGLTGGFRSGSRDQGVTFKNFNLRSD